MPRSVTVTVVVPSRSVSVASPLTPESRCGARLAVALTPPGAAGAAAGVAAGVGVAAGGRTAGGAAGAGAPTATTVIRACISVGWIVQRYSNVPGTANTADQLWPGRSGPESHTPALVTVCVARPRLVQVSVVPTGTVRSAGRKKLSYSATSARGGAGAAGVAGGRSRPP